MRVSVPATLTRAEEEHVGQRDAAADASGASPGARSTWTERAQVSQPEFGLAVPKEHPMGGQPAIHRWGSCTPGDGTIRISSRLAKEPPVGARLCDRARAGPSPRERPRQRRSGTWSAGTPSMERAGVFSSPGAWRTPTGARRRPVGRLMRGRLRPPPTGTFGASQPGDRGSAWRPPAVVAPGLPRPGDSGEREGGRRSRRAVVPGRAGRS